MGTRADFYVGTGPKAEWLGSVAWDGYEFAEDPKCPIMTAKTKAEFRAAVEGVSKVRKDWTKPEDGWPWPWNDSETTDYAYAFVKGKVREWHCGKPEDGWPDMKARQNVTYGPRSGLMVLSVKV